jgi:hypothetical protein
MGRSWSHDPSHEFQRLVWFTFSLFFKSFTKNDFFSISFNIGLLGLEFHDFLRFSFYMAIPISYLGSRGSRINPDWHLFFFFSFTFHHLVCLRVNLHCFIQFLICRLIPVMIWHPNSSHVFYSFLKLMFFFNLFFNFCFAGNWASYFFHFPFHEVISFSLNFYVIIKWDRSDLFKNI